MRHSQCGDAARAASIMAAELSRPEIAAFGQRADKTSALLPGPQPRSIMRCGAATSTRAAKSRLGRERSSANFRYCCGFQVGIQSGYTAIETAEILHQFERVSGKFARAAVEAAVARREEVTPHLLRILEETVDRAAQVDAEGDYMAHLYAMFLLAQFRETRAYPLVVRLASLPGDLLDSLCGDFITEDLGRVLASVCGGDLKGIQSVIENEDADEWARGAALGSLATLVAVGQKSRDETVGYFARLFRGKLARKWSHLWDSLVCDSCDLYPAELIEDIERAYEEGLVETSHIGFDDVKRDLARGKDRVLERLADDPHRRLVEDTVEEMGWWACFRDERPSGVKGTAQASAKANPRPVAVSAQIKSTKTKTGRNEPCPCGSGKKCKKCCGA